MSASITVETECGSTMTRTRGPQGYSSGQVAPAATELTVVQGTVDTYWSRPVRGWHLRSEAFAPHGSRAFAA